MPRNSQLSVETLVNLFSAKLQQCTTDSIKILVPTLKKYFENPYDAYLTLLLTKESFREFLGIDRNKMLEVDAILYEKAKMTGFHELPRER